MHSSQFKGEALSQLTNFQKKIEFICLTVSKNFPWAIPSNSKGKWIQ